MTHNREVIPVHALALETPDAPPSMVTRAFAEFIACAIFHFIGSVCPTPEANAVALMIMVYYSAKISGAHLNPAITMTFTLLGYTTPYELLIYWFAQVIGCIVGALWIALLVPGCQIGHEPSYECHPYAGCFLPDPRLSVARVFGWEFITTVSFIVPVFSVVWYTQNKSGYGNTGPIMVGLSLLSSAYAAASFTGAALNPARTLGSAIVLNCANKSIAGVLIAGQMLASLTSILLIVPWYGVASNAWYIKHVPKTIMNWLQFYQPNISLMSLKRTHH